MASADILDVLNCSLDCPCEHRVTVSFGADRAMDTAISPKLGCGSRGAALTKHRYEKRFTIL